MSKDRLMIRSQEEWWKHCMERGTSGDMVIDILEDWKKERNFLLKEIEKLKEETKGKIKFIPRDITKTGWTSTHKE